MAASTAKVPLPCSGTHSKVPSPCRIFTRFSRTRVVIELKSLSHEPQSRSMLSFVRIEVVRGPGVSRKGSAIGVSSQAAAGEGNAMAGSIARKLPIVDS